MKTRKHRNIYRHRWLSNNSGGFALVVVIVVLLLCSFLASDLLLQVRTELKIASNIKDRTAERFLAEGGINLGIFKIIDGQSDVTAVEEERLREGYPYTKKIGGQGQVTYYVINETGKIDLNNAPRELLEIFFEYHGLDMDQAATIIDSLLDWRDSDDLHRINGAEKNHYEALPDPYIPRNGAIQEPAEFFLVNGTTPLIGRFAAGDIFTVYNPQHTINVNSLTPPMLDFLAEGDEAKIEAYREAQELYGVLSDIQFKQIIGEDRYERLRPYIAFASSQSNHYSVVATGQTVYTQNDEEENDNTQELSGSTLNVLIEKQGAMYTILAWEERGA